MHKTSETICQDKKLIDPQAIHRVIEAIPDGWPWSYNTYKEVKSRLNWCDEQDRVSSNAVFWVLADHFGRCIGELPSGEQPADGLWRFAFLLNGIWMIGKRYGETALEAIACLKQEYTGENLVIKGVIGNEQALLRPK